MLTHTGGCERSLEEYDVLLTQAGFAVLATFELSDTHHLIEATPRAMPPA